MRISLIISQRCAAGRETVRTFFSIGRALLLSLTLVSCVMPVQIGGFPIAGVVLDDDSGLPIEGARVHAYFARSSFYGPSDEILIGDVRTDQFGRFNFEVDRQTRLGGTGGWSGRIKSLPSFNFEKEGYCKMGLVHTEVSSHTERSKRIEELQQLIFRLKKPSAIKNCIVKQPQVAEPHSVSNSY